jgi:hypothetical protein
MTGNNRHFSVLTMNVNGLNAPIKRTEQQVVLKTKTQPYIAFKRLI